METRPHRYAGHRRVSRSVILRRGTAPLAGVLAAVCVATAAAAYWTTTGSGTATGQTATVLPLVLSPGTPSTGLHPGGQADVAVTISNPNPFSARIGSLTLDTSRGTDGYAVDAGHSACGTSSLAYTTQSNNGAGWTVPPRIGAVDGTLSVHLAGAVSLAPSAHAACQGAGVTVYLDASADYATAILNTAGLAGYWPMGDDPTVADAFTGTPGTSLQSHTADSGAAWTRLPGSGTADAVITDAGRIRRDGAYAAYVSTGTTAGADYAVAADVHVRSTVAGDRTGVIARSTGTDTYYYAGYRQSDTAWHLTRTVNGVATDLATSSAGALTVGQSYRLRLDLIGSTIRLFVNETPRASASDATLTAAGRGGLLDGDPGAGTTATTDATGLHLDNVIIIGNTGTSLTDRRGLHPGTLSGAPLLNVPGALAASAGSATRFNGSTDYATVPRPVGDDFTVELWFRSAQGVGAGPQWWTGAGLVDATAAGNPADGFGVALRADGSVVAGVGNPDTTIASAPGFADDAWHHVALTRVRGTGAIALYVDGVPVAGGTANTNALTARSTLTFARTATGTNHFAGSLDDIAVYGTALSAATIADHHHIGHGS